MQNHDRFIFIVFLAFIMNLTLTCFFLYHLWLVSKGVTTNEKFRVTDYTNHFYGKIQALKRGIKMCEEAENELTEMAEDI